MKYSVVIPTYNHCDDFLKPCIDSIIEYTHLEDIELIISANGCTDGTREYLEQLKSTVKNLKIAWSDVPLGYPRATNFGIKLATTDKIVLLNNDTKFLSQQKNTWLNLLDAPFKNEKCGITCVVKDYSSVIQRSFAVFFCVMIHRKVFEKVGLLNEEFGTGSGEDMEFCIKTELAGFEVVEAAEKTILDNKYFTGSFPLYHLGEGTVHDEKLVPNWKQIFLRNTLVLANKYIADWKNGKIMNHPKIGVITPLYNDSQHTFQVINSVKTQTYGNVVHYIYDDCSTDGVDEALKEFLVDDPKIFFIRGEENRGQSHARNEAISKAISHGCEYIAFLDSDDFWFPNHLEKSIEDLKTKNCDVAYSTPQFVAEDGSVVFPVNIPVPHIFVGKQLRHNNFIWISSVVASAKCFLTEKFDSTLNSVEDWDMWLRLFEKGHSFYKMPSCTVRYLARERSEASRGSTKMQLFWQKHRQLPQLKLHLACGHDYGEDYINVDLYAPEDARCDLRFDVQKLPYDDNTVDEIKAFHIIEHFHFFEIQEVLKEWYRVLKPGGKLYLETPDFLETCRSFVEGNPSSGLDIEQWRILLYGHFFAHAWVPGQTHKFLFTETQLRTNLSWAGFQTVNRVQPASKYVLKETVNLFLTVEAFKK